MHSKGDRDKHEPHVEIARVRETGQDRTMTSLDQILASTWDKISQYSSAPIFRYTHIQNMYGA